MAAKYMCYFGVLLLLIVPVVCTAQLGSWETVRIEPTVMFMDLCMLPDGQHGWAVGNSSAGGMVVSSIVRTTDGGVSWSRAPFPAMFSVSLGGVFFATPDSGWVVGNDGIIYATIDGGDTWVQQMSPINEDLTRIHFIDSQEGWITGGWQTSTYVVLHTTDGGATWQNQSFGSDNFSCEDIFFLDSMNGWLCGRDNTLEGHIYRTTNGGIDWVRQDIPAGSATSGAVYSIEFATPEIGWATTASLYTSPAGAILYTTNGGEDWTVQAYTGLHYNYCLDVQDTLRVALSAQQILSPSQQRIWVTANGGQNWNQYTPIMNEYTYGIQYIGDDIWVAGNFSKIIHSSDNGQSWEWQYNAPLWNSIAWSDTAKGWIIAGSRTGTDGYCFRSSDGGESWYYDEDAPGGAQVTFVDSAHGWMLWEGNNSSVWRTTDGGVNWTQHYIGTSSWIGGIFFISPDSGWGFGSNGTIRFTSNGGVTWSGQSSGTSNYVQKVFFANPQEGWAVGGYGSGGGFIQHTTEGGAAWTAQTPAQPDHFLDACFIDDERGWLCAAGGNVHCTTNGGQSWSVISHVNHDYAEQILMMDEFTGWLVARNSFGIFEDGRGFIYRTNDGGVSWTLEWEDDRYPKSSISEIAVQTGYHLWACGYHDVILRYEPPSTVAGATNVPLSFNLGANYPNPFNMSTVIPFQLPVSSNISMVIYDILGRRVRQLISGQVMDSGNHSMVWDGCDDHGLPVSSGVYLYQMQVGQVSEAKKLVVIR